MTDLWIFVPGVVITLVTLTAVMMVGHSEAQDPNLNRALPRPQPGDSKVDRDAWAV